MKRLASATGWACLLPLTLSGCYWLASYQDLTSGLGEAGTTADAEVSSMDGAFADSAAPGDAATAVEASPEAGPFCPPDAGPLVYCMDFDGVDASALGLGTYQASAGLTSTSFVSPPSSLEVSLHGTGSSGAYSVQLPFQPTTAQLQFDVRTTSLDQWVTLLSVALFEESTQISRVLNAVVSPEGAFQVQEYFALPDGGNEQNGHAAVGPDGGAGSGAWHHVVLSLTVDDATQTYLSGLTVDGQVVEENEPLGLSWAQGNASLGIGVTYGGGGGPVFYFDNVRADFSL
jgi:hypothetical protein